MARRCQVFSIRPEEQHVVTGRLKQIRARDGDTTGPSNAEHTEWMSKMAHASAAERASEVGSLPESGRGHGHGPERVRSPPASPAPLGEGRPPWKASSQQAIPLKGRRQHGSSNALNLMHMSPSPAGAALDISEGGWLPGRNSSSRSLA